MAGEPGPDDRPTGDTEDLGRKVDEAARRQEMYDLDAGASLLDRIINRVAEEAKITKVKAVEAVEAVFDAMKGAMQRGERIELRGFGVFQVKPRKKGIGRNPRTGREVRIPPGKTIRFKPGKNLRSLN